MLKKLAALTSLFIVLNGLSGCMYYAEYADKRAETGIKEQYSALLEAHAACLKKNQNDYQRCPQPAVPKQ